MDTVIFLKAIFALIFVISLIVILATIYRKFNLTEHLIRFRPLMNSKITLEESLFIDSKRKVILIKYNKMRHLILLGSENETLIESSVIEQDS